MRLIGKARIIEGEAVRIVTFQNIPNIYRDLYAVCITKDGRLATSGLHTYSVNNTTPSFADDAVTTHSNRYLRGNATTVETNALNTDSYFGRRASMRNYEGTSHYAFDIMYFPNYANNKYKQNLHWTGVLTGESTPTRREIYAFNDTFADTNPITNINIAVESPNFFYEYSTVFLYGVPKLNETAKSSPKAIGGQRVATDGVYWYHGFTATGTFTPLSGLDCDVVVIAGGGSGGISHGGGGGAGGIVFTPKVRVGMPVTVTIGAGGSGAGAARNNGVDSSFGSITATGGGRGGVRGSATSAGSGGSGGGGGGSDATNDTEGSGTAGQGTRGGIHTNATYTGVQAGGAGGGGSGGFGENGHNGNTTPGVGGYATRAYDGWGRILNTGYENTLNPLDSDVMYRVFGGGGGGASSYSGGTSGRLATGRDGGGDGNNGAVSAPPNGGDGYPGHPATGGGGGGSWNNNAGNGGGGLVMVRYPV
jgi:hypothetical protein